ncbi:MAG: hypothetical protein OIF35_07380 [Cellvibrionaceae bacterium]|nr:hypothetical protein [Cellvibrionaceae bacterium]MCV6624899.1 hypothetical protein [Cellvibrionaceae bacterium]
MPITDANIIAQALANIELESLHLSPELSEKLKAQDSSGLNTDQLLDMLRER